ncbi:uncharacterized protein LY79DRAFT_3576 [Colletotrichum navitas]|uniref:Uncharacterized protein n=1 Tax=Colletotrichum navitas TaxID=681940 RepID=A0AAD8QCU4_9PEZI|nr:uncharacterized protein LY79DRAFT_3576 [Colletotrichum navitas]KAK1599995.1 hypothetical protein LY79DRAFT_3576 [Colletotrichum navitas]
MDRPGVGASRRESTYHYAPLANATLFGRQIIPSQCLGQQEWARHGRSVSGGMHRNSAGTFIAARGVCMSMSMSMGMGMGMGIGRMPIEDATLHISLVERRYRTALLRSLGLPSQGTLGRRFCGLPWLACLSFKSGVAGLPQLGLRSRSMSMTSFWRGCHPEEHERHRIETEKDIHSRLKEIMFRASVHDTHDGGLPTCPLRMRCLRALSCSLLFVRDLREFVRCILTQGKAHVGSQPETVDGSPSPTSSTSVTRH